MSQHLQNFVKFQKFQLENLVDFEKCCRTHIFLQKSEPIQPKTSNVLPKFCQPTLSDSVSPAARRLSRSSRRTARGRCPCQPAAEEDSWMAGDGRSSPMRARGVQGASGVKLSPVFFGINFRRISVILTGVMPRLLYFREM